MVIPAGSTSVKLNVPLIQDDETEGGEIAKVSLQPGTDYVVSSSNDVAQTTIVDNTSPWPGPVEETPPGHGVLDGPEVVITVKQSNMPFDPDNDREVSVKEDDAHNNGGEITYRVALWDENEAEVGATQAVEIKVKVTTEGGAQYGTNSGNSADPAADQGDFNFDISHITSQPGVASASYDKSTGILTVKLNPGAKGFDLKTNIASDLLTEQDRKEYDADGNATGNYLPDENTSLKLRAQPATR